MKSNECTICDECGKTVEKIWRVRKGHRYCATCYARVFKRRLCPRCGNFARLPKDDPEARCRTCETAGPCVRCGKQEYRVGRVTPYGPVCNSCAPHFRVAEPCEVCGTPSGRLTRVNRLGGERRLCPKCARADHATCVACRRHRLLNQAADGRMLCKACMNYGEIPCPSCGISMPAGRGKICESCYWTETCNKRVQMDCAAFVAPSMAEAFAEFGAWLRSEIGPKKAALGIHRYLPFFLDLEKMTGDIPSYEQLLSHFGAEGLRRVQLPMRWLQMTKGIEPDSIAQRQDSEQNRISAILNSVCENTVAGQVLRAYENRLRIKSSQGKLSLQSIRLALRPATNLLLAADIGGSRLPDQTNLDAYLQKAPGQRAALSGFLSFLREAHALHLVPFVDAKRVEKLRRRKLEKEMLKLLGGDSDAITYNRNWLSAALAYFHGLPRKVGMTIPEVQVESDAAGGLSVTWNDQKYWIPDFGSARRSPRTTFTS